MVLFEIVIVLLLVGALLPLWADRIGVPYPALLAPSHFLLRGVIGDDAFHAAEEQIDLLELAADARIRPLVEGDALATREPPRPS